ncbi:MAG: hypothetical protein RSP_17840 [Rhodanobacter sp.]
MVTFPAHLRATLAWLSVLLTLGENEQLALLPSIAVAEEGRFVRPLSIADVVAIPDTV